MSNVNRRDFLKMVGAGVAMLAVPKAVLELEAPVPVSTLPPGLELAIARFSTMRLDAFGISLEGMNEAVQDATNSFMSFEEAWRNVAVDRYQEVLAE